jgi:hypothetical protein
VTARVNLLNAFNFKNYSTFNLITAGANGTLNPEVDVDRYGNMYYVPRTITFELGVKF